MIILASKSPRRKELLSLITDDFTVDSAEVDETLPAELNLIKQSNICLKSRLSHLEKAEKSLSVRIRLLQLTAKF